MYRTILFIVVAAAAQAQTVEGPARITDIESRRTQRIEQHAAEVGKLMQKVEALSRMHQANPGDLVTEQQLEGEKTRVALAIKKFEDDLASYSDALADEVEHQAARLENRGPDPDLAQHMDQLRNELVRMRGTIREMAARAEGTDSSARTRLVQTMIRYESLEQSLNLLENMREQEGKALEAASRKAADLRNQVGEVRLRAEAHRGKAIRAGATATIGMVSVRSLTEEINFRQWKEQAERGLKQDGPDSDKLLEQLTGRARKNVSPDELLEEARRIAAGDSGTVRAAESGPAPQEQPRQQEKQP